MSAPIDIQILNDQLDAAERDAQALVAGLTEDEGAWRIEPGSWSVAECLDHLATINRVYLRPMQDAAVHARQRGRLRRGPAIPGFVGRWFVNELEPPVKARFFKMKAPKSGRPRTAPGLSDALTAFVVSQNDVRAFIRTHADLDLAGVRFRNPFVRGLRFSLATGLHNILAHERRHLWQARRVRQSAERELKSS